MRGLPFFKAKNKPQFAGLNFYDASSSGGGGGGGADLSSLDFSRTEHNTGVKWVDGKDVYSITKTYSNVTSVYDTLPSNIETIIDYDAIIKIVNNGNIFNPGDYGYSGTFRAYIESGTDFRVELDDKTCDVAITFYYTKSA